MSKQTSTTTTVMNLERPSRSRAKAFVNALDTGLRAMWRMLRAIFKATRLADGALFLFAIFLLLMPIAFVGKLLNWALARESLWLALSIVIPVTVSLFLFAAMMTNEQFLRDVHLYGVRWPSTLSIALAWLAVVVFGSLTSLFERVDVIHIQPSVPHTDGAATRYADLYLWHLFDSIPAIKFNDTVGWKQPYTYSDKLSGWLLLLFKILVIVSVIGSFVVSGRIRKDTQPKHSAP